jgi:hypothetical protein
MILGAGMAKTPEEARVMASKEAVTCFMVFRQRRKR